MLSRLLQVFLLLLCGCQTKSPPENVTKILETVESLRKNYQKQEAIDYLSDKGIYRNLDLLETLAFLYEENNETLLAAQTFEQLFHADIDKQYVECAFHAAEIYYQLGDVYSAARCYRLYLDFNPQDYSIWLKLSAIEEQLEHPIAALTAYLNGLSIIPLKTANHIKKLSELCYNNNMLEAAEFWGQIALKTLPNDVTTLETLLKIADAHNDRNKAVFYIRKLKTLKSHFMENHPVLYTKYAYKDIVQETINKTSDIIIPHDIHATQQEIEHTLQLISPDLKHYAELNRSMINLFIPLCPNSIY